MKVAVVDVGASSVRLLVAERQAAGLTPLHEEKERLHLGRDIERHGRIRRRKLARTAEAVERQAAAARAHGVARLSVVVPAPGRQSANAAAFLRVVEEAAGTEAHVLSPQEEARLAF